MGRPLFALVFLTLLIFGQVTARADTPEELRKQATEAFEKSDKDKAVELATKAIDADPKDASGYLFRGTLYETLRRHADAVADFGKSLDLDPKLADAYQRRGSEQFQRGNVAESVADFDKYLELR